MDRFPQPSHEDFAALQVAFGSAGGTVRGDDLACLLENRRCGNFVTLARQLVYGQILSFRWANALWVPMFQFQPGTLLLKPCVQRVVAELAGDRDDWVRAAWFAAPSASLHGARPVDMLDSDLMAVMAAARSDRFLAGW
jgi:hypothetical protein